MMEILHGGPPQGGEIVSEYSNAWIDVRHDNALISADSGVGRPCAVDGTARWLPVLGNWLGGWVSLGCAVWSPLLDGPARYRCATRPGAGSAGSPLVVFVLAGVVSWLTGARRDHCSGISG